MNGNANIQLTPGVTDFTKKTQFSQGCFLIGSFPDYERVVLIDQDLYWLRDEHKWTEGEKETQGKGRAESLIHSDISGTCAAWFSCLILPGFKHNLGLMILMPSLMNTNSHLKILMTSDIFMLPFLQHQHILKSNIILKLHPVNNVFPVTVQTVLRSHGNAQQTTCQCKHK